jgi:hypothetical protein
MDDRNNGTAKETRIALNHNISRLLPTLYLYFFMCCLLLPAAD